MARLWPLVDGAKGPLVLLRDKLDLRALPLSAQPACPKRGSAKLLHLQSETLTFPCCT